MKAILISEPGGPEVLTVSEVVTPDPGLHQVRVRLTASGINRADLLQREGRYPAPPGEPSDIPGLEYAGIVDTTGAGVTQWTEGDRVMGIVGGGGYAEYVVAHERTLVGVPEEVDLVEAGGIPEVFMTAYDALFLQAGLAAGETLLIHAVGSGVGTAALQLARRAGARTIGTSRTPDKLDRAVALGLGDPVQGDESWPRRVRELTGGRGVDVILDLVGGAYLAGNLLAMATGARHVIVGVPGGTKAELDLRGLMARRASIRGTVLRARPLEEKAALARSFERRVVPGLAAKALVPVVDRQVRPEDVADAHREIEANRTFGKVVIAWS